MAPGDLNMLFVSLVGMATGISLALDPLKHFNAPHNRAISGFLEKTFNVPSPPLNRLSMGTSEPGYVFLGTIVAFFSFYYFLSWAAADERFKRSTVWGRIPFGAIITYWSLQKSSGSNSFFLSFGLMDLISGLLLAAEVGIAGGLGYHQSQKKLKTR